jgi:Family of unknown function (DUF6496)
MARKYSKKASSSVERAMKKRKAGTLKSGRSGRKVKSRKQAIAIGLAPRYRRRSRRSARLSGNRPVIAGLVRPGRMLGSGDLIEEFDRAVAKAVDLS